MTFYSMTSTINDAYDLQELDEQAEAAGANAVDGAVNTKMAGIAPTQVAPAPASWREAQAT